MTQGENPIQYVGSFELKDGLVHFINDAQMHAHYGGFHAHTSSIFFGGALELVDPLTLRVGQRYIRIQYGDKSELISKFAEQCDAWHNIEDTSFTEEINAMIGLTKVMNPDAKEIIGSGNISTTSPSTTPNKEPGVNVRLRFGEGVGLRSMPKAGWTLQQDGNITDSEGNLLYIKAGNQQLHYPTRTATPSPTPTPSAAQTATPATKRGGLAGMLSRLFGSE